MLVLFDYARVFLQLSSMVVYTSVGRRFQNKGEVLLGYGRVCFNAFKYEHRLAKIAS